MVMTLLGNRHAGQAGAIQERVTQDIRHTAGDDYIRETRAPGKQAARDGAEAGRQRHLGKVGAKPKCSIPKAGDAVGNDQARKLPAIGKRPLPNVCHAPGDSQVFQAAAIIESIPPNAGDAGGKRHACQAGAILKGVVANAGDGIAVQRTWDGHGAARSGIARDGGFAIGNRVFELGLRRQRKRQRQKQRQNGKTSGRCRPV